MNSNKAPINYNRPEITRNNDLLATDQRKYVEHQKMRLEFTNAFLMNELSGRINSKIYSNIEYNVDHCLKLCKNTTNEDKFRLNNSVINTSIYSLNKEIKTELNSSCVKNCMNKNIESFRMLLNVYNK
jgi:hypothetical protein